MIKAHIGYGSFRFPYFKSEKINEEKINFKKKDVCRTASVDERLLFW